MIITVAFAGSEYMLEIPAQDHWDLQDMQEEWKKAVDKDIAECVDSDWLGLFTDILKKRGIKYKFKSLDGYFAFEY